MPQNGGRVPAPEQRLQLLHPGSVWLGLFCGLWVGVECVSEECGLVSDVIMSVTLCCRSRWWGASGRPHPTRGVVQEASQPASLLPPLLQTRRRPRSMCPKAARPRAASFRWDVGTAVGESSEARERRREPHDANGDSSDSIRFDLEIDPSKSAPRCLLTHFGISQTHI